MRTVLFIVYLRFKPSAAVAREHGHYPDLSFLPLRGSGAELSPSDYGAAHNAREKYLQKKY